MKDSTYIDQLSAIQARLNAMFEQLFEAAGYDGPERPETPGGWSPDVDVLETEDAYLLFAELPGLDRDDVDLEIEGRMLTLSGERRPTPVRGRFQRMECSHGRFRRSFRLDGSIDAERIEARMRHGVLEITLPKIAPGGAKIDVQSDEGSEE